MRFTRTLCTKLHAPALATCAHAIHAADASGSRAHFALQVDSGNNLVIDGLVNGAIAYRYKDSYDECAVLCANDEQCQGFVTDRSTACYFRGGPGFSPREMAANKSPSTGVMVHILIPELNSARHAPRERAAL